MSLVSASSLVSTTLGADSGALGPEERVAYCPENPALTDGAEAWGTKRPAMCMSHPHRCRQCFCPRIAIAGAGNERREAGVETLESESRVLYHPKLGGPARELGPVADSGALGPEERAACCPESPVLADGAEARGTKRPAICLLENPVLMW